MNKKEMIENLINRYTEYLNPTRNLSECEDIKEKFKRKHTFEKAQRKKLKNSKVNSEKLHKQKVIVDRNVNISRNARDRKNKKGN